MFCSDSHPFLKENQMDRLFLDLVRDQIGSQECSPQILHWRIYIPYLLGVVFANQDLASWKHGVITYTDKGCKISILCKRWYSSCHYHHLSHCLLPQIVYLISFNMLVVVINTQLMFIIVIILDSGSSFTCRSCFGMNTCKDNDHVLNFCQSKLNLRVW